MPSTFISCRRVRTRARRVSLHHVLSLMVVLTACADSLTTPAPLGDWRPGMADVVVDPARAPGVVPIDLGTLGGMFSAAWAINDVGVIVGTAQVPSGGNHMFVRDTNGTMLDAGLPSFARFAYPAAINNDGVVVGTTDQPRMAFRWTRAAGFQPLAGFPGESWASDVNNRGEIVGYGEVVPGSGKLVAALWRSDTAMRLLTSPSNASSSAANAINDAGVVVGGTFLGGVPPRAFRWTAATGLRDVGAPSFANGAEGINNRGTIVGSFQSFDGTTRGYRLDEPGRGVELGLFGDGRSLQPIAIGDDGTIVSGALDASWGGHSVRQRGAQQVELLGVGGVSGVSAVFDVNRCARAVGYSAVPGGAQHAVLWPGWC